jgi:hypothetical protein
VGHTIVLVESDGVVGTLTRQAFQQAGIPWEECYREDRGSLMLLLVPPQHALEQLSSPLAQVACDATPRARLRVAIHPQPGELTASGVGSAFRLLADPQFMDLITGAVDVAIVTVDGVFAAVPACAVVRPLGPQPRLRALNNLACHLSQLGEHEAALAAVEEAITTWQTLAAATPDAFHDSLARALALRQGITDAIESAALADGYAGNHCPSQDGMDDRP